MFNYKNKELTMATNEALSDVLIYPTVKTIKNKSDRDIILTEIRSSQMQISQIIDSERLAKDEIKKINNLIKASKEAKKMKELKVQIKKNRILVDQLLNERTGMLKLAKKLNIDVTEDVKNIRQIEANV
jgi:RecG-like helicase